MAIEIQYFGITGIVGPSNNKDLPLLRNPTTGVNGEYDVAVDPIDGPAQRYAVDFGVTSYGYTSAVVIDLVDSDIKDVMNNLAHGITGVLDLRVVYNY
jgi:hypothetical protein